MRAILVGLLLFSVVALAQPPDATESKRSSQSIDPQYEKALRMCMRKADQFQLLSLQVRMAGMAAELQALCAGGQRARAQTQASRYARYLDRDRLFNELRACSGIAEHEPTTDAWAALKNPKESGTDVCEVNLAGAAGFF